MARTLIILRHGETEHNATRRMQGQLDTKLSPRGVQQAADAAGYLATKNIVKIVSSDLQRAEVTAHAVANLLDLPVTLDLRLRETHLGIWQDKTASEVEATQPGIIAHWRHNSDWAPEGGENRYEVAARARAVVDELMVNTPEWEDNTVLLVAHGGTALVLTASLMGIPLDQCHAFHTMSNCCWAQLVARPAFDPDSSVASDRFTPETVKTPSWSLQGYNMGAALR